jgi:hypothetical protein
MRHGTGAAMLLAIGSIISGCDTPTTTVGSVQGTARDSADQVMFGVRSALTSAGLRRGELTADTMFALDAATRFELRGIRSQFTDTLGRPRGVLTATEGVFWLTRSTLETRGNAVVVADSSGRRLEGKAIRYEALRNQLSSDSPFVATGRGRQLTGVGFTADPGLFSISCTSQCSGSLPR